jgi:hypothetical protein
MSGAKYRSALEAAIREYERLTRKRAELDERIAQLVQSMGSLSRLCNLTPTVALGLTDACRMVLKAAGHPMTASEVRQQLQAMGFDVSRYANPLASIHTVLKRLCRSREARFVPRPLDKPAYAWTGATQLVAIRSSDLANLNLWWTSETGDPPKGA